MNIKDQQLQIIGYNLAILINVMLFVDYITGGLYLWLA